MKYIRTKNGIYEVVGADSCSYLNASPEMYYITSDNKNILKSKVIAQADTIVELCDEFIGMDRTCENGHQLLRAIPYKCANYWNGGIYGAIWTDKGLIYVAKMNDKGHFELV
jgi:hypothetical protein